MYQSSNKPHLKGYSTTSISSNAQLFSSIYGDATVARRTSVLFSERTMSKGYTQPENNNKVHCSRSDSIISLYKVMIIDMAVGALLVRVKLEPGTTSRHKRTW